MGRRPSIEARKEFRLKLGELQHGRLSHHADRLGVDMTDVAREAILVHLDNLDHREMIHNEAKRSRQEARRIAQPYVAPQGLGLSGATKIRRLFPEKIERSFRRFAEYMEQAPNDGEKAARAQTIVDEIKERVGESPLEVDEAVIAFKEFMKARTNRPQPAGKIALDETVVVAGDVDKDA